MRHTNGAGGVILGSMMGLVRAAPARRAVLVCALLVGAVFAGAARADAQQPPAASVVISQVDAGSYPDVRAVVTVLDAGDLPVTGLTQTDFTLSGDPALAIESVTAAQDASLGLSVVLAIDVSGSMAGSPLSAALSAASQFAEQLGPADQAMVLAFSGSVRKVVPFTADKAALTAGINALAAEGETSLYEAVRGAVFAARSSGSARQAVIVLSDGENDTTVPTTEADSLEAARSANVPVYTIGFGDLADSGYLQRLSAETRGSSFMATETDVAGVYAEIGSRLRNQYVLAMRSDTPADGAEATLQVTVVIDGQSVTSAPVSYARGVAPAPTSPAPTVAPPPVADRGVEAESGSSAAGGVAIVAIAVGAGAAVIGVVALFIRAVSRARAQRRRDRAAGQKSDQPLPELPEALDDSPAEPATQAKLIDLAAREPVAYAVGEAPLVIGSDAAADLRIEASRDVAPRHASLWLHDGRITLRHTGGMRPTLVDGRPIEVVILEDGDEFAIGRHRFRAEVGHEASTAGTDASR